MRPCSSSASSSSGSRCAAARITSSTRVVSAEGFDIILAPNAWYQANYRKRSIRSALGDRRPWRFGMESSTPARVLVVAHKTAATPALIEAVRERAARGPAAFTLLVPNPAHGLHASSTPRTMTSGEAQTVLDLAIPLLEEAAGAPVDGHGRRPVADERDPGRDQPPRLRRGDHLDAAGPRLEVAEARPAEQGHRARPAGHDGHRARPRSATVPAGDAGRGRAGRAAPASVDQNASSSHGSSSGRERAHLGRLRRSRAARPCSVAS